MGMVPNVSQELADRCARSDLAKQQWTDNRIPVLDGSTSDCEWTTDPDSTAPGVFGASRTPALFRNDYVSQMNDSHWLTNPGAPMTGYSPVFGDEGTVRSLRTRLGLDIVRKRISGADGLGEAKFTLASLQASLFQNRHLGAELVRDDLVGACSASGQTSLRSACEALAAWDLRVDLDSRGAHLFHLFAENGGLQFKTPFDPADPLSTPNTLDTANPKVLEALQTAVARLGELSIPVDATLGEVQAETRGAERIPIHGGAGPEGVFNVITVDSLEAEQGWTSIRHGSSWIMTVEFTPEGPRSQGILTYSQSTDPTSPFYSDQTRAYSGKQWDDLLFTEAAVEAATVSRQSLSE
jgi:acyl-homoserine-lactone acylase